MFKIDNLFKKNFLWIIGRFTVLVIQLEMVELEGINYYDWVEGILWCSIQEGALKVGLKMKRWISMD